jgi:glycosyltransferase involved in cell wall biosynthesis
VRHIVFVQWGDYRDAFQRFRSGGAETYGSQRYSIDHVASLTAEAQVSVLCIPASPHDEVLPNGVRVLGLDYRRPGHAWRLLRSLERLHPTDLVLCTPDLTTLAWALARGRRVLPLLADSFSQRGPRSWLKARLLTGLLRQPAVEVVANHNVPASEQLVELGVEAGKVVPWDWPPRLRPDALGPKQAPAGNRPAALLFVGAVSESKGVGDLIRALALLKQGGVSASLSIAGQGEVEEMAQLAAREGVSAELSFLGNVPHAEVLELMHRHDLVVVPSRHVAAEGLPMTIYEGLCSRTPLLLSDHPMFARAHRQGRGALVFRAQDPRALAARVRGVLAQPAEYERLSREAPETWRAIQCPLTCGELIERWLRNTPEDRSFILQHSLGQREASRAELSPRYLDGAALPVAPGAP